MIAEIENKMLNLDIEISKVELNGSVSNYFYLLTSVFV